jgi:hypothetical protein
MPLRIPSKVVYEKDPKKRADLLEWMGLSLRVDDSYRYYEIWETIRSPSMTLIDGERKGEYKLIISKTYNQRDVMELQSEKSGEELASEYNEYVSSAECDWEELEMLWKKWEEGRCGGLSMMDDMGNYGVKMCEERPYKYLRTKYCMRCKDTWFNRKKYLNMERESVERSLEEARCVLRRVNPYGEERKREEGEKWNSVYINDDESILRRKAQMELYRGLKGRMEAENKAVLTALYHTCWSLGEVPPPALLNAVRCVRGSPRTPKGNVRKCKLMGKPKHAL